MLSSLSQHKKNYMTLYILRVSVSADRVSRRSGDQSTSRLGLEAPRTRLVGWSGLVMFIISVCSLSTRCPRYITVKCQHISTMIRRISERLACAPTGSDLLRRLSVDVCTHCLIWSATSPFVKRTSNLEVGIRGFQSDFAVRMESWVKSFAKKKQLDSLCMSTWSIYTVQHVRDG